MTPVTPSVFVMLRSGVGVMTVFASVAELFPAGSFTPPGAVTVAVLLIVPDPLAVAVTVKVAAPPESRFTDAARFPLPLAGQLDPALAVQVHVAPVTDAARFPDPLAGQTEPALAVHVQVAPVSAAGKLSVTVAAVTALGPAFDATIVYVTVPF